MTKARKTIPNRIIPPIEVAYCKLTKEKFASLVAGVHSTLSETFNKELLLTIQIRGFEEPFVSTEDVVKELNESEWIELNGLEVGFYEAEEYTPTAKIVLGDEFGRNIGLKMYILRGSTKDKIAARESLRPFLKDYTRTPMLTTTIFTAGIITIVSTVIILCLVLASSTDETTLVGVFSLLCILVTVGLLLSIPSAGLHKYLVPHLETLPEDGTSRWDNFKKTFWGIATIVGIILAIIQIT